MADARSKKLSLGGPHDQAPRDRHIAKASIGVNRLRVQSSHQRVYSIGKRYSGAPIRLEVMGNAEPPRWTKIQESLEPNEIGCIRF